MTKTILVMAIAVAFVAGTLVSGGIALADGDTITKLTKECSKDPKKDDKIKAHCELLNLVGGLQDQVDDIETSPGDTTVEVVVPDGAIQVDVVGLQGPDGDKGETGNKGETGDKGPTGDAGSIGVVMKRVTLDDDAAGNAAGWNPPISSFNVITDSDITEESNVLVTISLEDVEGSFGIVTPSTAACERVSTASGQLILAACNDRAIPEGASIHYTVINSP